MRSLHVAALGFPSTQGTQALIAAMLRALQASGHETHLLCYAHGAPSVGFTNEARAGSRGSTPYTVHRAADWVKSRSLASGPSLAKLGDDVALAFALRKLALRLRPDIIVAHHVEAALSVLGAGIRPWVFLAHTSLSAELGEYFTPLLATPLRSAGSMLDRFLCRAAPLTLAVSPLLATRLSAETGTPVRAISLPWSAHSPITEQERRDARLAFKLDSSAQVVLYAGNFDGYQGLDVLAQGVLPWLSAAHDRRMLVASNEPRRRFLRSPLGALERYVAVAPLHDEYARRRVHAAADVALVPRKSPGGIPIKLVDAMSRGLPALATRRAACELTLGQGCRVVADDTPRAWRIELERWFSQSADVQQDCANAARTRSEHLFDPQRFVAEFVAHAAALRAL